MASTTPTPIRPPEDTIALPELYAAAESTATAGQRGYLRLVRLDLLLLIGGALLTVVAPYLPRGSQIWTLVAAAALIGATIIVKSANRILRADHDWIEGRAAAESIKTLVWRYVLHLTPFDGADAAANRQFLDALGAVLDAHPNLRPVINGSPGTIEQITSGMRRVRALPPGERLQRYIADRLDGQIAWYAARAERSRRAATRWFWIDLLARGAALVCAVLVIVLPHNRPSLAGIFTAVAAAATAWTQVGRNDEVSKSYALTAQKLLLLKSSCDADDEADGARLVAETEALIAHESTAWLSKRT